METASTCVGSCYHKDSMLSTLSIDSEARLNEIAEISEGYSSPRQCGVARSFTPPPMRNVAGRKNGDPLMRALHRSSVDDVRRTLASNPEAIDDFFFDHDFEPVLCAAVRLKCNANVIKLLLKHGADANGTDMHGRTARDLLFPKRNMTRSISPTVKSTPSLQAFGEDPKLPSLKENWWHSQKCALFKLQHDIAAEQTMTAEVPLPVLPSFAQHVDFNAPSSLPLNSDRKYEAWQYEIAAMLEEYEGQ